jgi:Uma2 family endonuclease
MTPEEFDALPPRAWAEGYRYELIHGVLVVTPPAGAGERSPNDELGSLLRVYKRTHPRGSALALTLPEHTLPTTPNRRRCDRAVWVGAGRRPDSETELPEIVVEFVSWRRRDVLRDYEVKRDEYARHGVQEYWIIDRFRRLMTVYKNSGADQTTLIVQESERYQSELLPGFVLSLAQILAEADAVDKPKRPPEPRSRGAE